MSKFKSKKFVAYLIGEMSWKFLIFYVIWEYKNQLDHYAFMTLVAMIITSGFMQVGYILGQAALDKYTHLAENTTSNAKRNSTKSFDDLKRSLKREVEKDDDSNVRR